MAIESNLEESVRIVEVATAPTLGPWGTSLTSPQRAALAHIEARAAAHPQHTEGPPALPPQRRAALEALIRANARVEMNFHPDRPGADGRTVAESLLEGGVYRSQFETGISNGSVSAYPGGERDSWERELFGGAYHEGDVPPGDRPRYGALALLRHADGAAPRFGSCYLVMKQEVGDRSTFTWGDSHLGPTHVGTMSALSMLLEALCDAATEQAAALGVRGDLATILARIERELAQPYPDPSARPPQRSLDAYIEAQLHGEVLLSRDVERLVADPSFKGTSTGAALEEIGRRYDVEVRWHQGFALRADEVDPVFRGPSMPPLALRIAPATEPRVIDCALVGDAVRSLRADPEAWSDWGSEAVTLQHLKQLWHVLVRFGGPR